MGRILVIGAGGVSTVAVKKIAMNADIFTDIMVASRTKSKCDRIAADIKNVKVQTAQVDADNVEELVTQFILLLKRSIRCQLSRHGQLRTAGRS